MPQFTQHACTHLLAAARCRTVQHHSMNSSRTPGNCCGVTAAVTRSLPPLCSLHYCAATTSCPSLHSPPPAHHPSLSVSAALSAAQLDAHQQAQARSDYCRSIAAQLLALHPFQTAAILAIPQVNPLFWSEWQCAPSSSLPPSPQARRPQPSDLQHKRIKLHTLIPDIFSSYSSSHPPQWPYASSRRGRKRNHPASAYVLRAQLSHHKMKPVYGLRWARL